jgi:hypothetical protein
MMNEIWDKKVLCGSWDFVAGGVALREYLHFFPNPLCLVELAMPTSTSGSVSPHRRDRLFNMGSHV